MIKLRSLLFTAIAVTLFSCEKEYSSENSGAANELIVGIDCRVSKIVYTDTATRSGIGSIGALINSIDIVTLITRFDSVSNTIDYIARPVYANDTVFLDVNNPDEYFIVDIEKRITKLHGLTDPTDNLSPQFDMFYLYNTAGYLTAKIFFLTNSPTIPLRRVDYVYTNGNLTHMTVTDLTNGDLSIDADLSYYTTVIPKRFIYLFPDEDEYPDYTQFFNFGNKSFNGVKKMTIRNYDPGNVLRDSLVTDFSNYNMSRDGYVLSVQMSGDNLQCIPALAGKLSFSYKCK